VQGTVVRREWHRVRRERGGLSEVVGEWVSDTVARCTVTTADASAPCTFTPSAGGIYTVAFTAVDRSGRSATTSFQRWASGRDWVPWNDESQFKMDVIPDRTRYAVGDTATVLFASPFTNAEAWITVEREGVIEQRRLRLTSGSTTLKFPITEAYAPNAFVSILVARGRSAPPGPQDDPGRPTIRVGYAELRVTPEVKRLAVTLTPERSEYRPGDSARVRVQVRDARNTGPRSEVTVWAVDEGVLSLTGYTTPDPIDLIYQERGLGLRLASNMTTVAPQVPEGMKGTREPGGGGGAAGADVLRSRFQTTAFFLGSVVTDAQGNATITAKLPDNLTTFRVMAVAVTAGDRYGKGQSPLLVTRPLIARQALPRFVRPGDDFTAGAVINRRDGTAASVRVTAAATGVTLRGDAARTATLAAGRGSEVRFPFRASRDGVGDSATFRFDVTSGGDADAVRVMLPVRPDYHPRAHTIAGVLRDTATVELALPAGIDPKRSRVTFFLGQSPLATIRGAYESLHVYPYYCTEQVVSTATPIIALYRAQREIGAGTTDAVRRDIARAVEMLTRRQRADGGIGYWS
jgi:alpha-2-macroglobulin